MQATLFLLILFISSSTSIKINDSDMELSNKLDELFTFYKKKLEHSNNKTNLIQLIENDTKKLLSLNDGNKTNTSSSSSFIQTKQTSFDYLNSPPYVWFQIPSMNLGPTSRRGHSTVPADTFMIVFGGCYMESPCFNDLYFFEFQSQSWTSIETTGTIPSARQGHSAVLYGSTMWVYGGSSSEGYLNDLYSLNLETREWTRHNFIGPNGVGRTGHGAVVDNKSRVVIFGGYSDKGYTNDILIINILEERYEVPLTTGHPPSARENFSMTIVNDRIFLFGGFHEGGVLNDLHSIDLLSWSWIKVNTNGPTPSARQGMASTRVGRKIFITGGCDNKQTKCFNDTFILDTDSFWWTQLDNSQNKITPRAYFQLIYFRSNIIGFGGCELYKQCFSDIITMNVEDLCPNKCSSKGECKEFIGCVCEPGYITHDCSMDIKCKDDCSKNGICRNSAKCSCFPGWSGVVCNTLISCPRNCTDYSNGVCQLDGKCKCNQNYTGDDCSVNLSQNSSNPLQELTNLRSQIIENELQDLADNSPFLNHPIDVPSCPNNCSGHGNCTVETSTCNCDTNYTSSDCSVYISQVPLQTNITQVKEEEKLVLKHRQSYIIGPEQSLYYETDDCKNSCSNVGVCLNSTCFCKQQYTYLDCSMTYKEYLHQGYKIAEMVSYFIALGVVAIIVTTVILILTRQKNDHTLLVS